MSGILSLLMGRRLCDRYHVHSVIGTGGMGAVCRATDERLGRDVAVKVLTLAPADPEEGTILRERFHREARAAAGLRHPNVVTVHDFGTDPSVELDFLVMEYLPGEDVAARLTRAGGALPVPEALEIFREGAMGVAAGHRIGLVHRDIKPRNLFLVSDPAGGWEVKVLDFGIAQLPSTAETLVQLTRFLGPHTPRYAAPEQFRGEPITAACDVYSLGLTALEMLTGRYPEGVNTAPDDAPASRLVAEVNAATADLPPSVAAVLLKALLRDPARRFTDANRLVAALDRAMLKGGAITLSGLTTSSVRMPGEWTGVVPPAAPPLSPPMPGASAATPPRSVPYSRPPIASPPPVAAPPAQPEQAGTAEPEEDAQKPPRRLPRRAIVVIVAVILAMLAYALVAAMGDDDRPGDDRPLPPVVQQPPAWTDPGRMREVARQEAQRAGTEGSMREGESRWLVILASFPEARYGEAVEALERVRAQGYYAGLGNSFVYPELRDGYVALVAGPYEREEALAMLPLLQETVAGDAFVKRVTLRVP